MGKAILEARFNGSVFHKKEEIKVRVWWEQPHTNLSDELLFMLADRFRDVLKEVGAQPWPSLSALAEALSKELTHATVELWGVCSYSGVVYYPEWP